MSKTLFKVAIVTLLITSTAWARKPPQSTTTFAWENQNGVNVCIATTAITGPGGMIQEMSMEVPSSYCPVVMGPEE